MKQNMKEAIGLSLKRYNDTYMKATNDRIDNIVSQAGTDNTEIVDARIDSAGVTHTTLNNRILAETKMNDEQLVEYTGSNISAEDTTQGYLKDVEILGNTIQNEEDLADIKSVGVLQEDGTYKMSILSCGKNLFDGELRPGKYNTDNGNFESGAGITSNTNPILVNSNTSYSINRPTLASGINTRVCYYTKEMTYISSDLVVGNNSFVTPPNTRYINFHIATSSFNSSLQVQLEEGTSSTPYEPYQGNKCDILLPCQLEKVGDVSDRLYYDDVEKAWCIEKNIKTATIDENNKWLHYLAERNTGKMITYDILDIIPNKLVMSNKLLGLKWSNEPWTTSVDSVAVVNNSSDLYVYLTNVSNETDFKNKLSILKPIIIKYPTTQTQKIVLPLSTQIALNSFFGTTHIYMESGEVEGTIKCKIPKSIGATVQSLNNKTDILSDRIEAIEGLKDSQNMKYETDKGYLVCKETKNGVIDDLKVEGKTLVNLVDNLTSIGRGYTYDTLTKVLKGTSYGIDDWTWGDIPSIFNIKADTEYTLIFTAITDNTILAIRTIDDKQDITINPCYIGLNVIKFTSSGTNFKLKIYDANRSTQVSISHLMLLEGDHTQNPPNGYFEGLMSVGKDVDKIEVSTANKNLLNEVEAEGYYRAYANGVLIVNKDYNSVKGKVVPNTRYVLRTGGEISNSISNLCFFDKNFKFISGIGNSVFDFTTPMNCRYITIAVPKTHKEVQLELGDTPTKYIQPQSDKKQILFYNENGELEPIQELHEWDSIEKHSDNKWYYHKRSGKVVLNGSENNIGISTTHNTVQRFTYIGMENITYSEVICDKFSSYDDDESFGDVEGICARRNNTGFNIHISKSKLPSQDVTGFTQWLQANNVTVVYQLAQEEVYELAPLHLDSYANETLILCNSGAISPKMEFSITSHINELVKAYGERINLLEEKVYKYMVTQNRMQLASTYSADSVTFKVDYFSLCGDEENYDEDLYNLILNNILVGKDNYDYDKMFTMILDYASWNQISWEQFDILVGLMDMQHNPPVEELPTEDEIEEDIIENEETPVE